MSLASKADDDLKQKLRDLAEKYFEIALEMGVDEAETLLLAQVSPELEQKLRTDLEARLASNDGYIADSLLPAIQDGLDGDELTDRAGMYASQLYATANQGMAESAGEAGLVFDWQLEPTAEHCTDCVDLAAEGPYGDPDDDNRDLKELPTFPGDGDTQCLSNCRCTLAIDQASWNRHTAALDSDEDDAAAA